MLGSLRPPPHGNSASGRLRTQSAPTAGRASTYWLGSVLVRTKTGTEGADIAETYPGQRHYICVIYDRQAIRHPRGITPPTLADGRCVVCDIRPDDAGDSVDDTSAGIQRRTPQSGPCVRCLAAIIAGPYRAGCVCSRPLLTAAAFVISGIGLLGHGGALLVVYRKRGRGKRSGAIWRTGLARRGPMGWTGDRQVHAMIRVAQHTLAPRAGLCESFAPLERRAISPRPFCPPCSPSAWSGASISG